MTAAPSSPPLTRLQALADQCVMCGLCLPHCPTYQRDRVEAHGPRGRIALINAIAASRDWLTAPAKADLSECLGCLRCQQACPAQVRYGELIDGARQLWLPPNWRTRLWLWLVARPRALRWLTGVGRRLRSVLRLRALRGLEPLQTTCVLPGSDERVPDALLVTGCSARSMEPGALAALLGLYESAGQRLQVIDAGCCGALHRHAGQLQTGARLARQHWARVPVDRAHTALPVLSWASGCQQQLRETAPGGVLTESVLTWFARTVVPRLAVVADPEERVGLWVPCTLLTQAGGRGVLESVLDRMATGRWQRISGLGCCGAAGVRHLTAKTQSDPLTDAVLDDAVQRGCSVLLSANPGCLHALRARAAERGLSLQVLHLFEWLRQLAQTASASGNAGPHRAS